LPSVEGKNLFYPEIKPTKYCLPSHRKSEFCTDKTKGKSFFMGAQVFKMSSSSSIIPKDTQTVFILRSW